MAKRRSRGSRGDSAPRAVASDRRERRAAALAAPAERATPGAPAARASAATTAPTLGSRTVGERPRGLFGPVPVSEIAILAGIVAVVVGWLESSTPALVTGTIVCVLAVVEVTAREHFSGFRSHSTLLAAIPAVAVEAFYGFVIGPPSQRLLLLVPIIPVFGICFWLLRRSFSAARHARLVNPPARPPSPESPPSPATPPPSSPPPAAGS